MAHLATSKHLVGVSEATEILGLNRTTLHRWIAQGKLPATQIGRHYKIALHDLERTVHFTASNTEPSNEAVPDEGPTPLNAAPAAKEVNMYSDELTRLHQRWMQEMHGRVRVNYSEEAVELTATCVNSTASSENWQPASLTEGSPCTM